jgi:allophanate hydrolase
MHTISELHQSFVDGRASVTALIERVLREVRAGAPSAWISLRSEAALLDDARRADAALAKEGAQLLSRQPLFGIPFAVKDNIDVAGLPTTAACPGFATGPAQQHAFMVARLIDAGAIPIGKTNLDQFATGLVGTRSPYGEVPNPFDADFISGGSSSGSAYVVSKGIVPFALGTDTAGSGRVPAGFCNLYGLKPTRGWFSTRGVVPACRSLDCISVFALSADDAWRVASAGGMFDDDDPYSRPAQVAPLALRKPRIGVPAAPEFFGDSVAAQAFDTALDSLRAAGYELAPLDFQPLLDAAKLLYDGPWVAERYAAVGEALTRDGLQLDASVASIIAAGAHASAVGAFRGQYVLEACRRSAQHIFADHDVLLAPTAPTIHTRAQIASDPIKLNSRLGTYTNFVNLLDMAAHALPGPFRSDGLPCGLTLIGPAWSDFGLARLAAQLAAVFRIDAGVVRARCDSTAPSAAAPVKGMQLAVVGAHLSGMPLNHELLERGARLVRKTRTAPSYRLYALANTTPPKPGLVRVAESGAAIELEIWDMPIEHYGSFVAGIPSPLGIGTLLLEDGAKVQGFVCEACAVADAKDVSAFGGWRNYLESLS